MKHSTEILNKWIDAVNETGRGLTDWEEDFMETISEQFETSQSMSARQEEILEKIYAEKTR